MVTGFSMEECEKLCDFIGQQLSFEYRRFRFEFESKGKVYVSREEPIYFDLTLDFVHPRFLLCNHNTIRLESDEFLSFSGESGEFYLIQSGCRSLALMDVLVSVSAGEQKVIKRDNLRAFFNEDLLRLLKDYKPLEVSE